MSNTNDKLSPEYIQKELDLQERLYVEELKKDSVFSVRRAIRERIKELKRVLETFINKSHK